MVENTSKPNAYLTNLTCAINAPATSTKNLLNETTVKEVSFTESLLIPGLQTVLYIQSKMGNDPVKILDDYYNQDVSFKVERPILEQLGYKSEFMTQQKIYRLSKRSKINYAIEQFELHACDQTLLDDAKTYVSKSWTCKDGATPDKVVRDILNGCIGPIGEPNIEEAAFPRDYIAENVHPFQVISQQTSVALTKNGFDPSFLHFMTYQNDRGDDIPTHNFRSLTLMAKQSPIFRFRYSGKGIIDQNYVDPHDVMDYTFPCDFDLLADILNGIDENGTSIARLNMVSPSISRVSEYGPKDKDMCGGTPYTTYADTGFENESESCSGGPQISLLKRRARMSLLDQDKIALRLTVPFNPNLNVGRVIEFIIVNPDVKDPINDMGNYGSGNYLICSMTHRIKMGGLGVTILDCVADTAGIGQV